MADFYVRAPGATAINPAIGETIEHFPLLDATERDVALDIAVAGFQAWRDMPIAARAEVLVRVAGHLRAHAERFARTMTLETGKPIKQARAEVKKCAASAAGMPNTAPL